MLNTSSQSVIGVSLDVRAYLSSQVVIHNDISSPYQPHCLELQTIRVLEKSIKRHSAHHEQLSGSLRCSVVHLWTLEQMLVHTRYPL